MTAQSRIPVARENLTEDSVEALTRPIAASQCVTACPRRRQKSRGFCRVAYQKLLLKVRTQISFIARMNDGRRLLKLNSGAAAALLAFNVGSGKSLALEPAKRPESQNGVRGRPAFDRRWRGNKVLRSSLDHGFCGAALGLCLFMLLSFVPSHVQFPHVWDRDGDVQ